MIRCINQATLLPIDTKSFLDLARKHSFTSVELDIGKVEEYASRESLGALKNIIHESKFNIVSLNAIENYPISSDNEMSKALNRCEKVFQLCHSIDCNVAVVNPNEASPLQRKKLTERFDRLVIESAKIAEKYNVRIGFEYVSYDDRVVNTLKQSLRCISRWDGTIGLVLDVFHMYRSGETIREMGRELVDKLFAFHVNDAPNKPISEVRDSDRVFPFEGVINLQAYVRDLREIGFDGPVSVELFNEKYWAMDPDYVMSRSMASLSQLKLS